MLPWGADQIASEFPTMRRGSAVQWVIWRIAIREIKNLRYSIEDSGEGEPR